MKTWTIRTGDVSHEIKVNGGNVWIDGERHKLRQLPRKQVMFIVCDYTLPIDGAEVLLAPGMFSPELVVDGVYVTTGAPYHRMERLPAWAYVFVVLNFVNLINGAIGGAMAFVGAFLTIRAAADPNRGTGTKVFISAVILLGCWVFVLVLAFLLALLILSV